MYTESRWSPPGVHLIWHFLCQMRWIGVDSMESTWIPGGNERLLSWAACKGNSTWTPCGPCGFHVFHVDSTWNLWGRVKSSSDDEMDNTIHLNDECTGQLIKWVAGLIWNTYAFQQLVFECPVVWTDLRPKTGPNQTD